MLLQYQESRSNHERKFDEPERMQKQNTGCNATLKFLHQLAAVSYTLVAPARA